MGLLASLYANFTRQKSEDIGSTIYDVSATDISGEKVSFERYRGKRILIVNTASKCGYTPQYAGLQKLHEKYGNIVAVLGFPTNDFLWQEPGSDNDISSFCKTRYGVTFKMFSKIAVTGKHRHLLFRWLQAKSGKVPSWNFCKYLVSKDGNEVKFFKPGVDPLDPAVIREIVEGS